MINDLKAYESKKSSLKFLPQSPGIYIFQDETRKPIYIGKAKNLKSRVSSYFLKTVAGKTASMVRESKFFSFLMVNSELEALLLEAKLVNKLQPHYNSELKDDKHPLYIKITRDKYPIVKTARKIEQAEKPYAFYGPFPSSTIVYSVLKMLRRIFPYSDHVVQRKACLRTQIGLCDPCPSVIESLPNEEKEAKRKLYLKNIKLIKGVLDGRITYVSKELNKKMNRLSEKEMFEEAEIVKQKIEKLEYITQPITKSNVYINNPNFIEDIRQKEVEVLNEILVKHGLSIDPLSRIECFDIAHTKGSYPTASMITFIDGVAEKRLYRHFRIFQTKTQSDVDSLREVIKRRKKHFADWGVPDLIIVDGGKPQVSVFSKQLRESGVPIVGLAKRFETLVFPSQEASKKFTEYKVPKGPALYLLQRMRDEAHRFARRYHHKLMRNTIFKN